MPETYKVRCNNCNRLKNYYTSYQNRKKGFIWCKLCYDRYWDCVENNWSFFLDTHDIQDFEPLHMDEE